jgi:anti-anti-sigma factor
VSKQTDEVIVKNLPPTLLGGRCLPAVRRLRSSRSLRGGAGERVDVPAMGAATGEPAAWRSVGRLAAWRWGAAPGAVSRAGIQVGHHPPGALAIERRVAGDALVFALSGALDLATRDLIHDALSEIDELAPRRLVVDLGGLTFIDASGLHKLLSLTERCREAGPALQLLPGPPPVHEAFETTGLAHRLPFTRPGGEDRVVTRAASGATIGDRCHGSRPSRARQSDGPTDDPGWRMWTRWKRLGDRCRR